MKKGNNCTPGSLHQMRAIATYQEMKVQLIKLHKDETFKEYLAFEMAMKIFYNHYEKWLRD